MNAVRFLVALWVGKIAARLVSVFFPARGTNLSGQIACRIMPGFLAGFRGIARARTVFITGTNGKSTSNNLVVHAFRTAGRTVATNLEGANQKTGIATTLIKTSSLTGRLRADYLILEVDERNLARVSEAIPPGYVAITNIQKDQVQRNGDPDYIYQKIRSVVDHLVTVFVNSDEPRSASLAPLAGRACTFGVSQDAGRPRGSEQPEGAVQPGASSPYSQTMACPLCHDALSFTWQNLAGVGRFRCASCGFSSASTPDYQVTSVDYDRRRFSVNSLSFHLAYDAAHFLYNYALCCAVATELGIPASGLARAFQTFTNVAGRLEEFEFAGKAIRYVRMKQENPETVQSAIDDVASDPREKVLILGLQLVHDIIPHYTNTAYFFDCDVDGLVGVGPDGRPMVEACICFGKTNCYDAATRLVYAGYPRERIVVVDSDEPEAILSALSGCEARQAYMVTMIGQYETLRAWANRRGASGLAVGGRTEGGEATS